MPPAPSIDWWSDDALVHELHDGWQVAAVPPDAQTDPEALDGLSWTAAHVPGTAAGALSDPGVLDFDAQDWWFRTTFRAAPRESGEEVVLRFAGLATVAEVHLNRELVLESSSMFVSHEIDVGARLRDHNELAIRFRALEPLLRERRRPRARWRTRVVANGNLRFFRTMLLGRAPGFAPGPAAVGPWRAIWLERRRDLALDAVTLRTRVEGRAGVLTVHARLRVLGGDAPVHADVELSGPSGTHRAPLDPSSLHGELRIDDIVRWWPHTHGEPALHTVRLRIGPHTFEAGRVGFRTLASDPRVEAEGLDLHVNGVPVFCRGAVWTPIDPVGFRADAAALRTAVEDAVAAGMNMLRLPGTGAYESDSFYDLCDELGVLVWQDFMFANLDYPIADDDFRRMVETEGREIVARLAHRPSVAVMCGNSEIEQQVAMLGLDPALGRGELFGELLPRLVQEGGLDATYVPSAPCGGELPFRPGRGIVNYYGVGGYRRPLSDARLAGVRFAAECLALANVPDEAALEPGLVVHHPRWKAGVPRDVGSGWDFDDVRDHYLEQLFGLDPAELRRVDHERYLELSRAVSGEVMAAVFGEWRRSASPCRGGLVLWLRDLTPGAGWGLVDNRGHPKVAYHHLRRALAPIATWLVDEGLGGLALHAANDRPEPLFGRLRVSLFRDLEQRVEDAREPVEIAAHSSLERDVETLIGRFTDVSWAYQFGPPAQDLVVASLEGSDTGELLSQAFYFPAGRPVGTDPPARVGLEATAHPLADGSLRVSITSRRLAYGVRVNAPGYRPDDDAFSVEPGGERILNLRPLAPVEFSDGWLTALNLEGKVKITAAR